MRPCGRVVPCVAELVGDWRWFDHEATAFVVCATVPTAVEVVATVDWRFDVRETSTRVVLELDPMLAADDVAAIYRDARSTIVGSRQIRQLSPKMLALALFFDERLHQPFGHAARDERNVRYPQWAYGREGNANFKRDARVAHRRLLHPGWRHPATTS